MHTWKNEGFLARFIIFLQTCCMYVVHVYSCIHYIYYVYSMYVVLCYITWHVHTYILYMYVQYHAYTTTHVVYTWHLLYDIHEASHTCTCMGKVFYYGYPYFLYYRVHVCIFPTLLALPAYSSRSIFKD